MVSDPPCPTISGQGLKVQVTPSAVPVQTNGELLEPLVGVAVGSVPSVGATVALGTGVVELPIGPPIGVAPPVGTVLKVAVGKVDPPVSLLVPVLEFNSELVLLASPR